MPLEAARELLKKIRIGSIAHAPTAASIAISIPRKEALQYKGKRGNGVHAIMREARDIAAKRGLEASHVTKSKDTVSVNFTKPLPFIVKDLSMETFLLNFFSETLA